MAGSKISLQDLIKRCKLSDERLNATVSDEHLKRTAEIIDEHELLGSELGLHQAEIAAINQGKSPEHQRVAMLKKWKQTSAFEATYRKLIEALLKRGRADLAQEVCEWLSQSAIPEQPSASASAGHSAALPTSPLAHHTAISTDGTQHGHQLEVSPSPAPLAQSIPREEQPPGQIVDAPEVSQPGLLGRENISQLRQQVKHLEKRFEGLLNAVSEDLEERKVPVCTISRSLFVRRASDTQTDIDLVAGLRHEIREADTVEDLFVVLSAGKCWDSLNPGLLKRIIDDHCSESQSIQHQKNEYLEELQQFRKATTARLFAKVCNVSTLSPKFSEVIFEMDKDWDGTLEDVEELKQRIICGQGNLSDPMLNFKQSKNSSLSLVWAFPRSCPISTTILRIPPSFYLEHGIRRVLVKGVCVVDVKFEEEHEEVVTKQPDIRLQLQERLQQKEGEVTSLRETIEVMESVGKDHTEKLKETEENLIATIKSNEELTVALEQAKSVQRTLREEKSNVESRVRKYELQLQEAGLTGRSVSAPHLHALEQEKLVKKKDIQITDYEDKITCLIREVETLKKLSEKVKGSDKGRTFSDAMSEYRDMLLRQHEDKERELLQELKRMKGVEGRKPTPPTGDHYVESRGIRYHMKYGCVGGNMGEVMILVSVGSEFPAGVQVQPRVRNPALAEKAIQTHGRLPPIVTGLHEEAAADLMARASLELQAFNTDLVHLCLDVPGKQRSKQYYLKTIEEFFKHCQQPLAGLVYLGHSEEGTGNWCFKDGTINFQEIFNLYRRHCPGKLLTIMPDCCYSGNWVRECAKTLDSLGIPPCGHRAREQGIVIKVLASCQADQKAVEPCYSVEGMAVNDDGILTFWNKQLSQQRSSCCDATRLACCRGPDESCHSEEVLKNWTWEDALNGGLKNEVFIVRGKDRGRLAWHHVLLSKKSEAYKEKFLEQVKSDSVDVDEWGYRIESGWGKDSPMDLRKKLKWWMWV